MSSTQIVKTCLGCAMIIVAIFLVADIFYMLTGSLEMFPTDEQRGKVTIVTTVFGLVAIGIEGVLFAVLKTLKEK